MDDPFDTVMMLDRWPVRLPAYRVEHCRVQPNWERERLLSMHAHLKPGDVLYDVGSEHGDLSALYGTWVRGFGELPPLEPGEQRISAPGGVVLVEGSEKFWPVIRHTFAANDLVPVACWAGFASDADSDESERTPSWATPTFSVPGPDGSGWPSWADGEPTPHHGFRSVVESGRTLPNIRFDTLAALCRPPNAMTIDVEGAEALVLRGSERILREHRPLVWVSLHPEMVAFDYPEWDGMIAADVTPWFKDFMVGYEYKATFLERDHEHHYICVPHERVVDPLAHR